MDSPDSPVSPQQGVKPSVSPQAYVDALVYARGYSTVRHAVLDSAYYNRPTSLQQASFRSHVLDVVRRGDAKALKELVACGLSSNPANAYGDSIAHNVCRVGRSRLLQVLLDAGGTPVIQQADENGCTPLHKSCAANSLECFELIVERDLRLLYMGDRLNRLPLECVPEAAWSEWISLLQAKQDEYWPQNSFAGARSQQEPPPFLTLQAPHSCPLKDPHNALPLDVAARVASGEVSPADAQDEAKRIEHRHIREQLINANQAVQFGHLLGNRPRRAGDNGIGDNRLQIVRRSLHDGGDLARHLLAKFFELAVLRLFQGAMSTAVLNHGMNVNMDEGRCVCNVNIHHIYDVLSLVCNAKQPILSGTKEG